MSATYVQINISGRNWDEAMSRLTLLDPYTHFVNKVLSEVAETTITKKPSFAEVYDVLFHGAQLDNDANIVNFRFYAHGLMIEIEHTYGVRYTIDERMIFEDGHFYDPGTFDWARLGDLHTMISFIAEKATFDVYLDVHLHDSDPIAQFDELSDALVEAARLAVIDGRTYTVSQPDDEYLTISYS